MSGECDSTKNQNQNTSREHRQKISALQTLPISDDLLCLPSFKKTWFVAITSL